mgnify:CR=1
MSAYKLYGGIEAGGTKFICGIGSGNGELLDRVIINTTTPEETLTKVVNYFNSTNHQVSSLGIGCFGPIDLKKDSENYGTILETPKDGWKNIHVKNILSNSLGIPVTIATDTDVATLGEQYSGKATSVSSLVYITIGTGVGGSIVVNNQIVHGTSHPEIGHMLVPNPANIIGTCDYHDSCLEGFVSGRSLQIRHGKPAEDIGDIGAWREVAEYISSALVNILMTLRPEMIILGGSVMKHPGLIKNIQHCVEKEINGYIQINDTSELIIHSSSDSIGVLGAIKLASVAT